LDQRDPEVPGFPFHPFDLGVCEDVDVGICGAFDKLGRKDAHGTVIGGKGLVQLGHLAADGRPLVHQIDLEAAFGGIQCGLDSAYAGSNHHDGSYAINARLHGLSKVSTLRHWKKTSAVV
jgi:hypothetical protein